MWLTKDKGFILTAGITVGQSGFMPTTKAFDLPLTAKIRNLIHLLEIGGYLICGTRRKGKDSNVRWVLVRAGTLFS